MRPFLERKENGFNLDRSVLEKIYAGNFQRLASESPKELNLRMAIDECEDAMDRISDYSGKCEDLETIEEVVKRLKAIQEKE